MRRVDITHPVEQGVLPFSSVSRIGALAVSKKKESTKKPRQNGRKMISFREAMAKLGAGVDNELGGSAPHQCR